MWEEGELGAVIRQLIKQDLYSGSTDLYSVGWRDVLIKPIFYFWFCGCFIVLGVLLSVRCLAT